MDRWVFFPAVAAAAIVVYCAILFGYLPEMWAPWTLLIALVCTTISLTLLLQQSWQAYHRQIRTSISRFLNRRSEIGKLAILNNEQQSYLAYMRASYDTRFFQAWDLDDTIEGLRRMGLIRAHEGTEGRHSRYEVPKHIWKRVSPMSQQNLRGYPHPPWTLKMRRGSWV